jgi:signal transduction histidine kinase
VDNAVKFSFEGGLLRIWTETQGSKVLVNIADTGEGIPEEDQASIFERFYKVDKSHSRSKAGAGIGLHLVKRIIAQHGEKITLKSEPGEGATFTFTLTKAFPERKR